MRAGSGSKKEIHNDACVTPNKVEGLRLQQKPALSNPQCSKAAGAAHSGCGARWAWSSKMADRFTTRSVRDGKRCHSHNLRGPANPRCSETAGPVHSAWLAFVSAWAAVVTPSTTGCRCFLMSHFYSDDKVSYPRRLKRPRAALEWHLWDARQTRRYTSNEKGGALSRRREEKWKCAKIHNKVNMEKGRKKTTRHKRPPPTPPVCLPVFLLT